MNYGPGPGQPPQGGWGPPPPPGGWGGGSPPPPPPPPPGPGGHGAQRPASLGSAIAALVASIVMLCPCTILAIPALVLSIIGLVLANDNPSAARGCTLAAWILLALGLVFSIVYFAIYGAMFFSTTFE